MCAEIHIFKSIKCIVLKNIPLRQRGISFHCRFKWTIEYSPTPIWDPVSKWPVVSDFCSNPCCDAHHHLCPCDVAAVFVYASEGNHLFYR